ncbi:MAG: hypothetical protein ACT4PL_02350 [Phycisphaerales bacterium]
MRTKPLVFAFAAMALLPSAWADPHITIRVSYKVVVNPADGMRPAGATDAAIDSAIAEMNELLDSYGRGYRFGRVDPVTEVGSIGGTARPNPSHYYGIDMLAVDGTRQRMEDDALANRSTYAWNNAAINIYINQANGGGQCAFPGHQLVAVGAGSSGTGWLQLHELGHFFDLCHTQGCPCGCCSNSGQTGECFTSPGNDEMADTLPDLACWDQNAISMHSFGVFYTQLTQTLRNRVDDTFLNIMSYHRGGCGHTGGGATTERLTEDQLDHWSDTALFVRASVCSGRTLQVLATASNSLVNGNSSFPYHTIPSALSASRPGDILLVRGGNYSGSLRISTPITLRTARGQVARIGQ